MKRLYLHFGTHKTGSTSIQGYLAGNGDFFARNGIGVVRDFDPIADSAASVRHGTNCFRIAHVLIRPSLSTPMRMHEVCPVQDPDRRLAGARAVNELLLNEALPDLAMSAEAFCFLRTRDERELFDAMFDGIDVRPFGFFREPGDWLRSWNSQLTEKGLIRHPKAEPGKGIFDLSADSWMVQHEQIKAFFGPKGVYRSYEAEVDQRGSVIPAFLELLGLDPEACPDWRGIWTNRSGEVSAK